MASFEEVKVLLVEDNRGDARLMQAVLEEVDRIRYELVHVTSLGDAVSALADEVFDIVLLDLGLPDSLGFDTFVTLHDEHPDVAIVVMTGLDDEELAARAVHEGAQDYLVKGQVSGAILGKALRFALERHQLQSTVRTLSLVDQLTGLHNRRGFMSLAEHNQKIAKRKGLDLLLFFVDLDGLKRINDELGHRVGDHALQEMAEVLRHTFRDSDIVSRFGGDEFVIMALEPAERAEQVLGDRLQARIAEANQGEGREYTLSASWGVVRQSPADVHPVSDLLMRADALMYEQKRAKRVARG